MLTRHILPQTQNNPSSGNVTAQVAGDGTFTTETLNFAYDYYTTDKQLRLTFSALQSPDETNGQQILRGIEMVFDSNVTRGTLNVKDGRVNATYWKMWGENGETLFHTYDADAGSVTVDFNHQDETYSASFSFESTGPGHETACITEGVFQIKGRDNFTL
jgi:hypothetical protein